MAHVRNHFGNDPAIAAGVADLGQAFTGFLGSRGRNRFLEEQAGLQNQLLQARLGQAQTSAANQAALHPLQVEQAQLNLGQARTLQEQALAQQAQRSNIGDIFGNIDQFPTAPQQISVGPTSLQPLNVSPISDPVAQAFGQSLTDEQALGGASFTPEQRGVTGLPLPDLAQMAEFIPGIEGSVQRTDPEALQDNFRAALREALSGQGLLDQKTREDTLSQYNALFESRTGTSGDPDVRALAPSVKAARVEFQKEEATLERKMTEDRERIAAQARVDKLTRSEEAEREGEIAFRKATSEAEQRWGDLVANKSEFEDSMGIVRGEAIDEDEFKDAFIEYGRKILALGATSDPGAAMAIMRSAFWDQDGELTAAGSEATAGVGDNFFFINDQNQPMRAKKTGGTVLRLVDGKLAFITDHEVLGSFIPSGKKTPTEQFAEDFGEVAAQFDPRFSFR